MKNKSLLLLFLPILAVSLALISQPPGKAEACCNQGPTGYSEYSSSITCPDGTPGELDCVCSGACGPTCFSTCDRGGNSNSSCMPTQGTSCVSTSNSCNMTNTGTVQCDGTCSATIPADSLCVPNNNNTNSVCTKNGGNVFNIAQGQDAGMIYFEPIGASLADPSYCIDFGVTINQDNTVTGNAFSPYYGFFNFSNTHMVVGRDYSAFAGTITLPGSTITLDTVDPDTDCGSIISQSQFPPSKKTVCVDNQHGTMGGYILDTNLGYISFRNVTTTWRPTPLTPVVTLTPSSFAVCKGYPNLYLTWTVQGTNVTGCTGSSSDGSFSGPKLVLSSSETVTPTQTGNITYGLSCTNPSGTGQASTTVSVEDCGPTVPTCTFDPTLKQNLDNGLVVSWLYSCGPTFSHFVTQNIATDSLLNTSLLDAMANMTGRDKKNEMSALVQALPGSYKGQLGSIHGDLSNAIQQHICSLEQKGVKWNDLANNLHLSGDPLNIKDPNCGANNTYMACNNQNQCVQMAGTGADSCSVANQVTDCDLIRPTASANPSEGTYTTATAGGKTMNLTVLDNTGGSGLDTVKYFITSDAPNPSLAKTSGTAITLPVSASPISYPTTVGTYYLNVYAIDKGKTPNELFTSFGPYNVTDATTHLACDLSQQCIVVSGAGGNLCSTSSDCSQLTHNVCDSATNQCITITGGGSDQCTTIGATCASSHMACNASNQCVSVSGAGADTCSGTSCTTTTHKACDRVSRMCTDVAGPGIDRCTTSDDCGRIIRLPRCIVSDVDTCSTNDPNSKCYLDGYGDIIAGCNNDPWPPDIYQRPAQSAPLAY